MNACKELLKMLNNYILKIQRFTVIKIFINEESELYGN